MHSTGHRMSSMFLLAVLIATALGCAHAPPEQQSERKTYLISEDASGVGSNVKDGTGGAGAEAYCNQKQIDYYDKCINRKPSSYSVQKGSAQHHNLCTTEARQEFEKCVKELEEVERQEAQSLNPSRKQEFHFPDMNTAIAWLKGHKTEVALGALVVVGGALAAPAIATYLVGLSTTGALVLVAVPAM